MVEKIKEREVTWLDRTEMIDGRKWIIGDDKYPCKFMVIGERPGRQEDMYNKVLCGEGVGDVLDEVTRAAGFDYTKVYRTNAVKYMVRNDKVGAGDVGRCRPMLDEEIKRVDPSYIVCLGATAFKAVMGNKFRFSDYNGAIIPYPGKPNTLVYVTYNPLNLKHNDGIREDYIRHWRQLAELQRSGSSTVETTGYEVITTPEQVANLGNALFEQFENPLVTLDCEWHGRTWMDPERYIRTIQLGIQPDMAIIIELRDEQGKPLCKDEQLIFPVVGKILSDPRIRLAGHNIISDGEWLLSYDVDIRPRTVIDTMLSEMLLNESGPFGLEMLTLKYTKMGRYDVPLQTWVKANKAACEHGYGPVPRDILLPYAANDVGAPYRIIPAQVAQLQQYGFFNPRNQYPSLFHITMETQRLIYELERTGMLIDVPRLELIMKAYSDRMVQCESMLIEMAASVGMNSFNHRAHAQVRELLFDRLGLTPIKDTKGKPWRNMGSTNSVDAGDATPSTDKNTLEIVQEKSPIIKQLMSVRKLDMALKYYLNDDPDSDESTKTGGIMTKIWPDGRTHTHFSQLSETGRFRHSRPNCFPGDVEVLTDIGWMRWNNAYMRSDIQLAQWDDTQNITFDKPIAWLMSVTDRLVSVNTRLHVKITATADHNWRIRSRKHGTCKCVKTSDLSDHAEYLLPQAGTYVSHKCKLNLTKDQVALLCAYQADGSDVYCNGVKYGIDWCFSKPRKIVRLESALKRLKIPYHKAGKSSDGRVVATRFYVGVADIPEWLHDRKLFGSWLLDYDSATLALFEREVWQWDGCVNISSRYASKHKSNADWVQILCLLNNRRGRLTCYEFNDNRAPSWQVGAGNNPYSYLTGAKHTEQKYPTGINVYCATMPTGRLIVRSAGRYVAFSENSANLPKKVEGDMAKIFGGKDQAPPVMRTIFVPAPGYLIVEGDFIQAELFVLAGLSGDKTMWDALNTPGKDLHDLTAVSAFKLRVLDPAGKDVSDQDLVELAKGDGKEFKQFVSTLRYLDLRGRMMTREEFKNTVRVSSKNLNFGIPLKPWRN